MSILGPSFANKIVKSKGLYSFLKPLADKYANLAGYRACGLKYDDLLMEENPPAQKALSRLSERESYDRAFRLRTAHQCAIKHSVLPKNEHVTKEADVRYLTDLIKEAEAENAEREYWETVKVEKKQPRH